MSDASDLNGTFVWYDQMSNDLAGAEAFYAKVVGWTLAPNTMNEQRYTLLMAGGAAIGAFSLYLLEPRDRRRAPWLAIAFGSPVFIYSVVFWEHTLATALCLGAAALSLRADPVVPAGPFRCNAKWIGVGLAIRFRPISVAPARKRAISRLRCSRRQPSVRSSSRLFSVAQATAGGWLVV